MLKSFVIENTYFWTSHSSSYSFGRSHMILMTILITLHLSFLKVLSCRSSIISGLRKHRWQWSQCQRLSRGLVYILVLFQINCLGSMVGTWTVEPNAKGQVGESNGDSFHCNWQQLEKPEITLSHRCWGEIWLGLGWEKDTYWSKRKNKQEPWEKMLDSRYSQWHTAQKIEIGVVASYTQSCGSTTKRGHWPVLVPSTAHSLLGECYQSFLKHASLPSPSLFSFLCFPTRQHPVCCHCIWLCL